MLAAQSHLPLKLGEDSIPGRNSRVSQELLVDQQAVNSGPPAGGRFKESGRAFELDLIIHAEHDGIDIGELHGRLTATSHNDGECDEEEAGRSEETPED